MAGTRYNLASRLLGLGAALVAFGLPAGARADDGPGSTTIHARSDPDGAAVTHISSDRFAAESLHVGDLVAAAPGTSVIDYGGMLATTTVSIRGASADEVQVVFDGVPLSSTSGGGFDLSLIPAALIDSVDVRRGSEGSEFGAGAMGGTVVLQPAARTRALLTAGSLGTYGASASWAAPPTPSGWRWVVAADVRHSAGAFLYHRDPTPELSNNDATLTLTRQNNDATLGSALVRASRTFASSLKLSGLVWMAGVDRGLPGPIYSPTPFSRQHEGMGFVDLRLDAPTAGQGRFELPVTIRGDAYNAVDSGVPGADGAQHTIDVATRPRWTIPLGTWLLTLSGMSGYELLNGALFGYHSRLRVALGADAKWESGRWTAALGLREERWGSAAALLPHLGGTIRLIPELSLAASVGAGFRPPSFGELYYAAGPVVPNPDLVPERSYSGDVSLRFRRAGLTGAITGFGGLYQDVIIYEIYSGFRAKPFNIGEARCVGGELELRWHPPVPLLHGFVVTGAYTRSEAVDLMPGPNTYGKQLPYRPEDRGDARLDYVRERWRAALELQATGMAYINRSNTRTLDAFADLRASAGVRLWGAFWLSAEMRNGLNVLDRMTIDGYPLPGRVVLVHLSWEPADDAGDGTAR